MTRSESHDVVMAELYREDPDFAVRLLNDVIADGDRGDLLTTLRQLTLAFGGVRSVAAAANLNPTQLYRTLSSNGNPALSTLTAVLKVMGLRLEVRRAPRRRLARAQ